MGHRRFGHPRSATDYVRDAPAMRPSTQQPDQPENGGNAPRASESEVQILSPRLLRSAVNAVPSGFERWHWLPLGGRRACARADSEASPGGSSPHAFIGAAGSVERGESMLRFSRGCGPATSDPVGRRGAAPSELSLVQAVHAEWPVQGVTWPADLVGHDHEDHGEDRDAQVDQALRAQTAVDLDANPLASRVQPRQA